MNKLCFYFLFSLFFISSALARCSDSQININTASAEELDKIIYIGPVTAGKIIGIRPFNSIDELINVSGIGETKLKAIKNENLACVENSESEEETETEEEIEEKELIKETQEELSVTPPLSNSSLTQDVVPEIKELQVIKLNAKDIKDNNSIQENQKENLTKKYAQLGLIALCILILILLFLQKKHGFERERD